MSKILVTGGCGFIGSHSVVDLMEHGYECLIVDNYLNSGPEVLDQIFKVTGKPITNFEEDITNKSALENIFKTNEIEGIIHFAALKAVGESVEKPLLYYKNNINGMINLLDCAIKYKVKHFIFSSSCTVYGHAEKLPVTELSPINKAESPYGFTKQVCEQIMEDSIKNQSINGVILRYFNPAGAHESNELGESPINPPLNLIPIITEVGIGKREKLVVFGDNYNTKDGSCIRDYVHVMDLADAHTKSLKFLMDKKVDNGHVEIFNLGSGTGTTVIEAINAFEKQSGQKLNYEISGRRNGDIEMIFANAEKAKAKMDWTPKRDINDIMISAWNWEQKRRK